MRRSAFAAVSLLTMALAACGSDAPEYEVVEQIKVREPGAAPPIVAAATDLVAVGERVFATCTGCHAADKDSPSSAGPNLYGVFGREAGALDDFAYSEALAGSGITWDEVSLDRYIADPEGAVPGTYMSAGAVPQPEQREALIAYLETLKD